MQRNSSLSEVGSMFTVKGLRQTRVSDPENTFFLNVFNSKYFYEYKFVTNMTQLHFVTRSPTLSQLCFCFTILNLYSKLCQTECFIE